MALIDHDDITLAKTLECLGKLEGGKKKGEKQQTYTDAVRRHSSTREGVAGSRWLRRNVLFQGMLLCSHDNQCPLLQLGCNRQRQQSKVRLTDSEHFAHSLSPDYTRTLDLDSVYETWPNTECTLTSTLEETVCISYFLVMSVRVWCATCYTKSLSHPTFSPRAYRCWTMKLVQRSSCLSFCTTTAVQRSFFLFRLLPHAICTVPSPLITYIRHPLHVGGGGGGDVRSSVVGV